MRQWHVLPGRIDVGVGMHPGLVLHDSEQSAVVLVGRVLDWRCNSVHAVSGGIVLLSDVGDKLQAGQLLSGGNGVAVAVRRGLLLSEHVGAGGVRAWLLLGHGSDGVYRVCSWQ